MTSFSPAGSASRHPAYVPNDTNHEEHEVVETLEREPQRDFRLAHVGGRGDGPERAGPGVGLPRRQQVRPVQDVEDLTDQLDLPTRADRKRLADTHVEGVV